MSARCLWLGLIRVSLLPAGAVLALPQPAFSAERSKVSIVYKDEAPRPGDVPPLVVTGVVFEDVNDDKRFSPGVDRPVPRVGVTDGEEVTVSDPQGRYVLGATGRSGAVWISHPQGYQRSATDLALLPPGAGETTMPLERGVARKPQRLGVDFPLKRSRRPDPSELLFIQAADLSYRGEKDAASLAAAIREIESVVPEPAFVAVTGNLLAPSASPAAAALLHRGLGASRLPWFIAGDQPLRTFNASTSSSEKLLSPPWFSADHSGVHLLFLGTPESPDDGKRQRRWLEEDLRLLAREMPTMAFLASPPDSSLRELLSRKGIKMVFSGGSYAARMRAFPGGMALVEQSPLLMGGIDASPAGFRVARFAGGQLNTEFRIRGASQVLKFTYPQRELGTPQRFMANIFDFRERVSEARFRLATSDGGVAGEGEMKQVGPLTWMGTLDPEELGVKELPPDFVVAVRARGLSGAMWENGSLVQIPQRKRDRPAKVETGQDWPQFMGNAQHTGQSEDRLVPPLRMVWATPTHGSIDVSSPVFFQKHLAIGVKDRDNLINNGVAMFNPETGELTHFTKSDSMVCGTPTFVEDAENKGSFLYATAGDGTMLMVSPDSGELRGRSKWGGQDLAWLAASPTVQGRLAVGGGPGSLMGLLSFSGDQRWISTFGKGAGTAYGAPTMAGPVIVIPTSGLRTSGRDTAIYAVDANSGQVRWFNGCTGTLGSVMARAGKGYVLDREGLFKVIDLKTGQDQVALPLGGGLTPTTPAMDDEVLVLPTSEGKLHAFTTNTLDLLWTFEAKPSLWTMAPYDRGKAALFSSPTLSGDFVYIGCTDGHLYALDKRSGEVRWSCDFGVPTLSTPCISGNTLFTAACDGNVYAFVGEIAKGPEKPSKGFLGVF